MRERTFKSLWALLVVIGLMIVAVVSPIPTVCQERQYDNILTLSDKTKANRKQLVAANMDLTESEADGFWPVYEKYQKDLNGINQRISKLIESYMADYQADTLTDEKAKKLIDEFVAIEQAEAAVKASYVPKVSKVLPPKKVARYLQIEYQIRTVWKYGLVEKFPLVQ